MTPNPLTQSQAVEITYVGGTCETVHLRPLTIRELYRYGESLARGGMPETIASAVGRPVEWVDQLTPESYAALGQAFFALNFHAAAKVMEGDVAFAAKMGPFIQSLNDLQRVATLQQVGTESPALSPASASSPAGAGTNASTIPSDDSSKSSRRPSGSRRSET